MFVNFCFLEFFFDTPVWNLLPQPLTIPSFVLLTAPPLGKHPPKNLEFETTELIRIGYDAVLRGLCTHTLG